MTGVKLKARIIFSAVLLAFLFFVPLMLACNNNKSSTPPTIPTEPTLNDIAKEDLANFYDKNFFPFDKVTVLEIVATDNSSEFKFNFSCENIVEVKLNMANNLYMLGFTQTIEHGFSKIEEDSSEVIYILLIENATNFTFTAHKEAYIMPEVRDPLEVRISEIVGFDFELGGLAGCATEIYEKDNSISFLLAGANFTETCEVIKANFADTNCKTVQTDFMLTIILRTYSSVITLTLANDESNLAFSLTKR